MQRRRRRRTGFPLKRLLLHRRNDAFERPGRGGVRYVTTYIKGDSGDAEDVISLSISNNNTTMKVKLEESNTRVDTGLYQHAHSGV